MSNDRYHRQSILPGFGPAAQSRLSCAHVMVIGAGALGCPALDLLARAGAGRLSIVDRDLVELTNLQRQTLYGEGDIGTPKAEAAAKRLRAVNSSISVHALVEDFAAGNAEALVRTHPSVDVLLDCTDNFQTRYLLNDVAVKHGVPLVYGGAVGTSGVLLTITPPLSACLRCVFPEPPAPGQSPTCDSAGIFAPVSAIIGANQASEAIKVIVNPEALSRTLLSFDLWKNHRQRLDLRAAKDPSCPCCGLRRFEFLNDQIAEPTVLCGRNAVQVPSRGRFELAAIHGRIGGMGSFSVSATTLSGTLHDGTPLTLFADGRAIVGRTTDPSHARSVLARTLGH